MTYEDRCELEEMFMGFVTRNEEPTHEDRMWSWGTTEQVFDEDIDASPFCGTEAERESQEKWNSKGGGRRALP